MPRIETLATLSGGLALPDPGTHDLPATAGTGPVHAINGELGAAGTPIFSGFLRELGEYNPQFAGGPFSSFMLFEQMRRSDAQVAMVLNAVKLPIRGAEWQIETPDGASDTEKEAAEFVEEQLFHRVPFKAALENALLCLDFGCAAHEDIWEVDSGQICLADLAPRLPLTFYRWETAPDTDRLTGLNQMGYRAGTYVQTTIPVEKLALFTFRQEGANYAGRSLLREIYQHWYTKQALYAIDAITCERNGMGVPVVTMGPKNSVQDRLAATAWVQSLIVHEKTGLVLPNEWTFKLHGVEGKVQDCKESIAHHNTMIATAGLLAFMVLGQQHSSNRSVAETMADFFFMGEQGLADMIGAVFSETTIKRLVDFNFPNVENYPRLIPQQIMALEFNAVVDALNKLGLAQVITPDAELESWVRKKMGAPEQADDAGIGVDPETGDKERPVDAPGEVESETPAAAAPAGASPAGKPPVKTPARPTGRPGKAPKVAASDMNVPNLKRAPKGAECFLALTEIVSGLDKGRDDVAAALRAARPRIQAELVNKLANTQVRKMHTVSIAPDVKLIAEIEKIIAGLYDFGQQQVAGEIQRQRAGKDPSGAARIRMTASKRDPLGIYADGVVSEFQNGLAGRAANVALDRTRRTPDGTTKGEVIQQIDSDLDGQSDKWIDGVASKGANEAFADGRQAGYDAYKDEIGSVIYSALLDINTCEFCADADGAEGATPDDIPDVPNPDCDGGDKCRCVHVYVFSDEGKAAA